MLGNDREGAAKEQPARSCTELYLWGMLIGGMSFNKLSPWTALQRRAREREQSEMAGREPVLVTAA